MGRVTSLANSPIGLKIKRWIMFVAHRIIRRPRERSLSSFLRNDCRAVERWHQTMKNRVLLENYYLPGDLERQIGAFVDHYNHRRYHESLQNLTPADVYFGRGETILKQRERIKQNTIETRCLLHRKSAA